jgi:hypothetical protein
MNEQFLQCFITVKQLPFDARLKPCVRLTSIEIHYETSSCFVIIFDAYCAADFAIYLNVSVNK